MGFHITVLPARVRLEAAEGGTLLDCLRKAGLGPDAPCGGDGRCGKCRVTVDGREVLACQTVIDRDMTVTLPSVSTAAILTEGILEERHHAPGREGYLLALDVGTTTVVGYLLDGKTGQELASESAPNPQAVFGADVISRIRHGLQGHMEALTGSIRACVEALAQALCRRGGIAPERITLVSLVGNPAMQQLFLGIRPDNLAAIPFAPVLTEAGRVKAGAFLPTMPEAELLVVPDISGFVGADTVACVLATRLDEQEELTLLVDIGTNGEMVLGNRQRMVACSAAAGPALEGANIRFGMRGQKGAIDHVTLRDGQLVCSVIGGGEALGICGSGLVDAIAAALDGGLLNPRGKILTSEGILSLTDRVFLTQEDIRQVQLAKGAIAAGIHLMAEHLGIMVSDIQRVFLAGAFGTYMDPRSACRMGLLPAELEGKTEAVGNAAGSGAKLLARSQEALRHAQTLVDEVEFIELASAPGFQRCFARNLRF